MNGAGGSGLARTRGRAWLWPAIPIATTLAVMRGAFSASSIFVMRDMTALYWPYHEWFRATVAARQSLLWDPYSGFGQSAIAEPTRHLLFPPIVLLRLLLPSIIGFNLGVALPFPIAALGMFVFLRRRLSGPGAALGATVFAACGPVVSSGIYMNLAWTIAIGPWLFWAFERWAETRSVERFGLLAVLVALELLAGEPVVAIALGVILTAYAAAGLGATTDRRSSVRVTLGTIAAMAVGSLLAAPQLVPLAIAVSHSWRGQGFTSSDLVIGSLHPLSLAETVAPWLFGDGIASFFAFPPWQFGLHHGFEPIIYSTYIGVPVVALVLQGIAASPERRRTIFWATILGASLVLAFGINTPVYELFARLPVARSFRFPVKFLIPTCFAAAIFAGHGIDALWRTDGVARPSKQATAPILAFAALCLVLLVVATIWPSSLVGGLERLAVGVAAPQPQSSAVWLLHSLRTAVPRVIVLALGAGGLIWLSTMPRYRELACMCFLVIVPIDFASTNGELNPTADAGLYASAEWAVDTRSHPHDRVYVGPRIPYLARVSSDSDAPRSNAGLEVSELPDMARRGLQVTDLAMVPAQSKLRDSLSNDILAVWPVEYRNFRDTFISSDRDARLRFLDRVATRYFVVPYPPERSTRLRDRIRDMDPQALYEREPTLPRAVVVPKAVVVVDHEEQIRTMFEPDFDPSSTVLLDRLPGEPTERARPSSEAATAVIDDDGTATLGVQASVPSSGGYLVVSDSYDSDWTATVDDVASPVYRANGLFRAVRLTPGTHVVRFVYVPRAFYAALIVSGLTALAIAIACLLDRRRLRRA